MTTFTEAVNGADALIDQLQGLIEDPRYLPRFFDTIFGLRTALGRGPTDIRYDPGSLRTGDDDRRRAYTQRCRGVAVRGSRTARDCGICE
jgi:hypothetical protein